jgi:hypothetical protein
VMFCSSPIWSLTRVYSTQPLHLSLYSL